MKKLFIVIAVAAMASTFASCVKENLSGSIADRWVLTRQWSQNITLDPSDPAAITDTTYTGQWTYFTFTPSRITVASYPAYQEVPFSSTMADSNATTSGTGLYAYDPSSTVLIMDKTAAKVTRIGALHMTIEFWTGGTGGATATLPTVKNIWYFDRRVPR